MMFFWLDKNSCPSFNIEGSGCCAKAAGVRLPDLKADDALQAHLLEHLIQPTPVTQRGSLKRVSIEEIPATSRAKQGLQVSCVSRENKPLFRVFLALNVWGFWVSLVIF